MYASHSDSYMDLQNSWLGLPEQRNHDDTPQLIIDYIFP